MTQRLTIAIVMLAILGLTSLRAEAFGRDPRTYPNGVVTAHSRVGNGSMTVPVRPIARGGYQMRLPSGSWVSCEGDCERTLQNKVLDFWDNQSTHSYPGTGVDLSPLFDIFN